MNKVNQEMLEKVIRDRLNKSLDDNNSDRDKDFNDAMEAIDRQIELDKHKKDVLIKLIEVGAISIAVPFVEAGIRKMFVKLICEFEKDYTFTTSAGKSLSKIFKF